MSWIGIKVKSPRGQMGKIVGDDNWGFGRTLEVHYRNGRKTKIELNNVGANPAESQKWKFQVKDNNRKYWAKIGY